MNTSRSLCLVLALFAAAAASSQELPTSAAPVAAAPEVPQAPAPAAAEASSIQEANATEQASVEELIAAAAAAAAATPSNGSANLRGAAGWGHGIFGETCCMCSMHHGFTTVLYAAADYSHLFGGHAANWWCQSQCEVKCHLRGGHMFGCYDEQHLLAFDAQYGHRSGYLILHDQHFGNIC